MGEQSQQGRERRADTRWGNVTPFRPPQRNYDPQPPRSAGSTDAERLLARLCRSTFLSTWSFPNIFHGERRGNETISKEVCDLLVVFENDVIIFSDKECLFPESATLELSWARWYRRAIEKSAKQLHGAERVIRAREPLYLDADLQHPFPLPLPSPDAMRVHRVLVAHGVSERCHRELGGNGTLMISPDIVGDDHVKRASEGGLPFAIGRVSSKQPFVHILDETSLQMLMGVLDTAFDLIRYLTRREEFIATGRSGYLSRSRT